MAAVCAKLKVGGGGSYICAPAVALFAMKCAILLIIDFFAFVCLLFVLRTLVTLIVSLILILCTCKYVCTYADAEVLISC